MEEKRKYTKKLTKTRRQDRTLYANLKRSFIKSVIQNENEMWNTKCEEVHGSNESDRSLKTVKIFRKTKNERSRMT